MIYLCCFIIFAILTAAILIYQKDMTNDKNYYIEKIFSYKGYSCVVILHGFGHRCGYVGVPKGHATYGLHYDELDDISVHGGLTYSKGSSEAYPIYTEKEMWWFGFDCAHCFDGKDYQAVYRHIPACREQIKRLQEVDLKYFDDSLEVRTTRYVVKECKQLVNQLIEKDKNHGTRI